MSKVGALDFGPWTLDFGLSVPADSLAFFILSDSVDGIFALLRRDAGKGVFHQEGVLAAVFIISAQDPHRAETLRAEKELRRQVSLADGERDPSPSMTGQFANQLGDHLRPDAGAPP